MRRLVASTVSVPLTAPLISDGRARCAARGDPAPAGEGEGAAPRQVLDAEVEVIRALGARVETGRALGRDVALEELAADFDAVVLATGAAAAGEVDRLGVDWGLEVTAEGVRVAAGTFAASRHGVFAAGSAVRPLRHVAAAAAQGRSGALAVDQHLAGGAAAPPARRFSSVVGTLLEGEMAEFLAGAESWPAVAPAAGHRAGFTVAEAARETRRCLRCDCRSKDSCRLRAAADRFRALQRRYAGREAGRWVACLNAPAPMLQFRRSSVPQ